ncbi:hypothetical protein [Citricoccus nitrophenolicus]|uniref:hypothetical protein n=3 Tax=Citricoccus nitrophenolicus TaxID=863575 RepID=UPI0039B4A1D1
MAMEVSRVDGGSEVEDQPTSAPPVPVPRPAWPHPGGPTSVAPLCRFAVLLDGLDAVVLGATMAMLTSDVVMVIDHAATTGTAYYVGPVIDQPQRTSAGAGAPHTAGNSPPFGLFIAEIRHEKTERL